MQDKLETLQENVGRLNDVVRVADRMRSVIVSCYACIAIYSIMCFRSGAEIWVDDGML